MAATPAVFKGTVGALRTIGGRKVIAVTVEVPIEHQSIVAQIAEHGAWVAVARISEDKEQSEQKDRRRWNELPLSQQAAIRCGEIAFREFCALDCEGIKILDLDMAADHVREFCGVSSRKELDSNKIAAAKWRELEGRYDLWCRSGAI
jgi:hypothetical protein